MRSDRLLLLAFCVACWAAVALLVGCERGLYAATPPARYRGDNLAAVSFVETADTACRAAGAEASYLIRGCVVSRAVFLPNPCAWPGGETYAQLACHELGHVNGWPADHPGGE